jgi:hypothetical protein
VNQQVREEVMALRGRKRSLKTKRRSATTSAARTEHLLPPIETMVHRLAAVGNTTEDMKRSIWADLEVWKKTARPVPDADAVKAEFDRRYRRAVNGAVDRAGLRSAGPEFPVDVLMVRGGLIGAGESDPDGEVSQARADVAARFAALHWRLWGYPCPAQDNGYNAPLNEEQAQEILERAKQLVDDPPLSQAESQWLAEARHKAWRGALLRRGHHVTAVTMSVVCGCQFPRPAQLQALRTGLQTLVDTKLPGRDDIPDMLREAA